MARTAPLCRRRVVVRRSRHRCLDVADIHVRHRDDPRGDDERGGGLDAMHKCMILKYFFFQTSRGTRFKKKSEKIKSSTTTNVIVSVRRRYVAALLMSMLNKKVDNVIQAHKMLACSMMPPPIAKEVFDVQWTRLRKGQDLRKRRRKLDSSSAALNFIMAGFDAAFGHQDAKAPRFKPSSGLHRVTPKRMRTRRSAENVTPPPPSPPAPYFSRLLSLL